MLRLLIAGIPGMGKTDMGNYLQEHHGFKHVDMEVGGNIQSILTTPDIFVNQLLQEEKIVLTWGFRPFEDAESVLDLKSKGFKIIWYDGDRESARREFTRRSPGESNERAYQYQLMRIETSKIVEQIDPIQINTFTEEGIFRGYDDIAEEILDKMS